MDDVRQVERIQRVTGASQVFAASMNDLLDRALAEATGHELSLSQLKLLMLISRPGRRFKVSDVAEILGVTNAAASRSIDRLVQRGLLNRTPTPEDRRAVDLTLTKRAEELLGRFNEVRDRELMRRIGHQAADKLERIAQWLDELSLLIASPDAADEERCLGCGIHFRHTCLRREVAGQDCTQAGDLYLNGQGTLDQPRVSDLR